MPKENPERIIDSPYTSPTSRGGAISIGTGGGGGGGGGATNLDALTDVTISGLGNGQVLSYNAGSGQWVNSANAQSVPNPHGLSSGYHNGLLNWSLIDFTTGSDLADIVTRRHVDLQGMTPNDHHNQAHVLATGTALGGDHTISGAATGEVLRAIDGTHAAFDQLGHTDLGSVAMDQHHPRQHDIITGDTTYGVVHTVVGADFTVVGVHPVNTIALLPTSSAPGAAVSILKTDSNGGIQLDTNLFYVDGANNWVGINRTPSGAALDVMAYSNADHTQRIKQKVGQTGRLWRIEDVNGDELIVLDSVGNLQSGYSLVSGGPGFVSGLLGWRITPQGNAEFNNIWARGELHATVFVKDEVHATGGTFYVATAGVLHDDAKIDSTLVDEDVLLIDSIPAGHGIPLQIQSTSGSFTGTELHVSWVGNFINVNDPPSGPAFYFNPGDVIRVKTEIAKPIPPDTLRLADLWLEINSATQNDGYATYSVLKRSGSDCTVPKGTAMVSYGKEGDGRILMTSDLQNAPYLDVFTVGPQVWTGNAGSILPRVRLGRLDGLPMTAVSGIEQYGIIAGTNLSDANSGYFVASNLGIGLYKVPIRVNNGVSDTGLWSPDGNLKLGKNIGATATTSFEVISQGANAGDVYIGDRTGTINPTNPAYLYWNQQAGTLYIRGDLVIGGGTGTQYVTVTDAQLWDSQVDAKAQGYAANAQTYSDAHRIVATGAIFTSGSATTIAWASFTVQMASGGARTIAAGSATISTRTYLYINIALGGNLTLTPTPTITLINQVGYILIAVADPGTTGATGSNAATVTVVVGSTYIAGGNIFTRSIQADRLVANSISAGELTVSVNQSISDASTAAGNALSAATNAQTTGGDRLIQGVSGTWTVFDGDTIGWSGLSVKMAGFPSRAINAPAAPGTLTLTPAGRWFLFVDVSVPAPTALTMASTNTFATLTQNHALIAVVDTSTVGPTPKANLNIVAGSTYISGGNIATNSIIANRLAANTITANYIDSSVYISAGAYRAAAISDAFSLHGSNAKQVDWSVITVQKGDGTSVNISAGSFNTATSGQPVGTLFYLSIPGASTGTVAMSTATNDVTTLAPGAMLIAIVEVGAIAASYRVVAGGTLITGDQIVTGSIVAGNIAAGAVTAQKISVDGNVNITGSGALTVGTGGSIHSSGKTYGTSGTDGGTGYFLGFNGSTPVLSIGSSSQFLLWNGTTLSVQANSLTVSNANGSNMITLNSSNPSLAATMGLLVNSLTGSGPAITFSTALEVLSTVKAQRFSATASMDTPTLTTPDLILNDPTFAGPQVSDMIQFTYSGNTHFLGYDKGGVLSYDGAMTAATSFSAPVLIGTAVSGLGLRIPNSRTPSGLNDTGSQGDFCWSSQRLYVKTDTGWHFVQMTALP